MLIIETGFSLPSALKMPFLYTICALTILDSINQLRSKKNVGADTLKIAFFFQITPIF